MQTFIGLLLLALILVGALTYLRGMRKRDLGQTPADRQRQQRLQSGTVEDLKGLRLLMTMQAFEVVGNSSIREQFTANTRTHLAIERKLKQEPGSQLTPWIRDLINTAERDTRPTQRTRNHNLKNLTAAEVIIAEQIRLFQSNTTDET